MYYRMLLFLTTFHKLYVSTAISLPIFNLRHASLAYFMLRHNDPLLSLWLNLRSAAEAKTIRMKYYKVGRAAVGVHAPTTAARNS